jgi:hypothetical protein
LIELSGAKAKGRNFVYFTEVKNIPATDLATMERLWNKFSKGKFGYSVQKVGVLLLVLCANVEYDNAHPADQHVSNYQNRKSGSKVRATSRLSAERLAGQQRMVR